MDFLGLFGALCLVWCAFLGPTGFTVGALARQSQLPAEAKRLAPYPLPVHTITSSTGRRIDMGMGAALPNRITRLGRCPGMPSQSAKAGRNSATSMGIFICA